MTRGMGVRLRRWLVPAAVADAAAVKAAPVAPAGPAGPAAPVAPVAPALPAEPSALAVSAPAPPAAPPPGTRRYPRWLPWLAVAMLVAANWASLARSIPGLVQHALGEQSYGIIRHEVTIELPWPAQAVYVHDRFTVLVREDLGHVELAFSLGSLMRVEHVRLPDGRDLRYARNSFQLGIRPPPGSTWAGLAGEDRAVTIDLYLKLLPGRDDCVGLGRRGLFLLHRDGWLPATTELSMSHTGVIRVIHPRGLPVAASGRYAGQAAAEVPLAGGAGEDMVVSTWVWDRPLSGLTAVVASPEYTVVSSPADDTVAASTPVVLCYVFPDETATAAALARFAARCVDYLSGVLGQPPPMPYQIVSAPREGNIAAQGNYGLTTFLQSPGGASHGVPAPRVLATVAHEIAHHWWGHVCQLYHAPGGIALAEGMAEYWAVRALLDLGDRPGALRYTADRQRAWRAEFAARGDRIPLSQVWVPSARLGAEHITYLKAGAAFQALEWFVGRDAFDEACRSMVAACDYGPGTLEDLRCFIEIEAAADRPDLTAFWARWFDGAGVPSLVRTGAQLMPAPTAGPGRQLWLEVEQGGVPFPLRIPAEIHYADNTVEQVWVELRAERVSRVEIPLGHESRPVQIRIDPLGLGLYNNEDRDLITLLTVRVSSPGAER